MRQQFQIEPLGVVCDVVFLLQSPQQKIFEQFGYIVGGMIYQLDSIVRRAASLQLTADARRYNASMQGAEA